MPGRSDSDAQPTRTNLAEGYLLAPGTRVAGRYRIVELLGVGGMGMVYRARDERLDLEVALKVLRPEAAAGAHGEERFRRELILARQVTHKNVVRIHDFGEDGELRFLTMDLVPGRSLQAVLAEQGALAPEQAAAVARQLADGLAAAHEEGVVHRDLKPANVLLDEDGTAYLTDFGVARSMAGAALTRAGSLVGTPDYLSPEQASGGEVDGRSDIYALGLILFEMLTGELPFRGETMGEVLGQRLSGRPRTPRELGVRVPRFLERILGRCLEREPAERYQSASDLAADLAGVRAPRGPRAGAWRRPGGRRLAAWTAAGVLVLALAALGVVLARRAARGPASAAAPSHAVAILPLADETGRTELAWAPTGLAEMLTSALAESPALRVVDSQRVSRTVRDLGLAPGAPGEQEARQLAELLDVDRLVVGTVRSAGDVLRVDAHLLGPEGSPVGTGISAQGGAGDGGLFQVVARLGGELRERLEVAAPAAPAKAATTASTAALSAYSRGVAKLAAGDAAGAAPELERAVAEDAGFAAGWVRLAGAYDELGYHDKALEAARRAVSVLPAERGRLAYEARAREALLAGEPKRAQAALGALVARYPHDVEARIELARAYGDGGHFDDARKVLLRVAAEEPNHPRAWYLLGKYAVLAGDSRRAVDDYLVRALVIQNRLGNAKGRADVLNALGVAYDDLGELDRAAERYGEAAEIRSRIGDRRGYAATLTNLGSVEFLRGHYAAGRSRMEEARGILEAIGDREGVAGLENDFGILEEERGRYQAALDHYRQALQMRQDLGDHRALAESYNNVGFAFYLLGQYDNAGVYWHQALDLYQKSGNREGQVIATQSLGLLDLVRGEWSSALESFLAALDQSRALGLRDAEAVSLGHLGRVAELQGRYGAARESYSQALAIVHELADARGLAEFSLFEASVLIETGRAGPAKEQLANASGWLREAGNQEQQAELERLRGELSLLGGRLPEAREAFGRALGDARSSGSFLAELRSRLGLAEADLAAGRTKPAVVGLESVATDAGGAGCQMVALEAAVALAEARRAAGDLAGAERAAREGLRLSARVGPYARAWRLHRTLAAILDARGEAAGAGREWAAAGREVDRLRESLAGEERKAFEHLPEVESVVETVRKRAGETRRG